MERTSPDVNPAVIDTVAPLAIAVSSTSESVRFGVINGLILLPVKPPVTALQVGLLTSVPFTPPATELFAIVPVVSSSLK